MNRDQTPPTSKFANLKDGLPDAAAVSSYYDDWAGSYDETLAAWNYAAPEDSSSLIGPHLAPGARILDVGCGTGLLADALSRKGDYLIDGIDVSALSLEQARQREAYDRLMQHDLTQLPLPVREDGYDGATCVGVLTYFDDAEPLLSELCRCVRSDGMITFTQRTDLWEKQDFSRVIDALDRKGLWSVVEVGAPRPYLPGNDDYGSSIEVIHTLCRVN